MAKVWDPARLMAKWKAGMSGAGASWMQGINSLSQSPTQLAAAPDAMAAYASGCANSIANGRRLAGLNRVDAATFKQACQAKQANLGVGAAAAGPKVQAAFQNLIPVWQQMKSAAAGVGGPKGVNSVAKFTAAFNALMSGVGKQAK